DGFRPKKEVQFGVKGMTEEQLDDNLLVLDLLRQPAQAGFIRVGRSSHSQLLAEVLGQLFLQTQGGLVINLCVSMSKTHRRSQFFRWRSVHTHEQSAAVPFAARPTLDEL